MRTLGLIRPGTDPLARTLSIAIPLVLIIGMSAVSTAVLFDLLR